MVANEWEHYVRAALFVLMALFIPLRELVQLVF